MRTSPSFPRVGLRQGARTVPATPVLLRGHEASLVVPFLPAGAEPSRLVLAWEDGSETLLRVRLRHVDGEGRIAHLDVVGVEGDWSAFATWLGRAA